ncbi:MAG: hypothetical protein AMJ54_06300 [Deltaproteobacteria bacterium SG8_13]|nr:MAG: hypothetical protein AMJ54_06300 [Deltaproteobacteria bacterium SG8_13]
MVLDFDPAWGLEKTNGKSPSFFYSFSYTPLYQFETDLNRSGSFDVSRHYLRFDVMRRFNRNLRAGVGLSYDFEKWDFNNLSTVAGASPWSKIHRPGISLPVFYSFADSWTLGVIPSIELAGESGARSSESLTSGAVVSLAHPFSQRLALGLGFGIFDRLEKTRIFPFILINWEINEQLRLSNPLRAGPAGPAGLELVYMLHRWELGIGGAYRSYRFRLDDTSAAPNGVGENEFVAAFFRVQRKLGPNLALDLAAGGLFAGELTVEDSNGIKIGADEYDTSPFVALTLAGKF